VPHKPFVADSLVIFSILGQIKNKMCLEGWPDCPIQFGLCLYGLPSCADRSPKTGIANPMCAGIVVPSQRWKRVAVSSSPAPMKEQLYSRVGCSIYPRDIFGPDSEDRNPIALTWNRIQVV
jgi:hypothetical protein